MVTARRSTDVISSSYEPAVGGVAVLERPQVQEETTIAQNAYSKEEERRKINLDRLLNYDRYAEVVGETSEVVTEQAVSAPVTSALSDEDIRPTSTTMQFGEDIDQLTRDMSRTETIAQEGYQLNKKGKIVVMLYALVVTVILALIVLNTGVLASLSTQTQQKSAELNQTVMQYESIQAEIENMTSSEYVKDIAMNEYGMVQGN